LALFLGGVSGLVLSETFTESNLPSPTALTIDTDGNIFGATEGVEVAIAVILGLGGGGGGGGGGGEGSGGGGEGLGGGGEGGRAASEHTVPGRLTGAHPTAVEPDSPAQRAARTICNSIVAGLAKRGAGIGDRHQLLGTFKIDATTTSLFIRKAHKC